MKTHKPEWIPVSEGYPRLGTWCYVLCSSSFHDSSAPLRVYEDIYADIADDAPCFVWTGRPVFAWMPYPSPDDPAWRYDEPPLDTEVLVLRSDGDCGSNQRCVFADGTVGWRLLDDVQAWMPVPEYPVELRREKQ